MNENMRKCRICGCDDNHACKGGCSWVEIDLCSQCFDKLNSWKISIFKGVYSGHEKITVTVDPLVIADELESEDKAEGFVYGYVEGKNELSKIIELKYEDDPIRGKFYTVFIVENIEDEYYYFFEEVES